MDLPAFCPSNVENDFTDPGVAADPWSHLHPTAQSFLHDLGLPPIHPACVGAAASSRASSDGLPPPPVDIPVVEGASPSAGAVGGIGYMIGEAITLYSQVAPALLAVAELWLRLFAVVLAPLMALYLVWDEVRYLTSSKTRKSGTRQQQQKADKSKQPGEEKKWRHRLSMAASVLGLASAAVLVTDSLYVHEGYRTYGAVLFLVHSVLSTRAWLRGGSKAWVVLLILLGIKVIATYCLLNSEGGTTLLEHPGIDLPDVTEGIYYSKSNPTVSDIVSRWPETYRTYAGTPWLPTGDAKTGIPFLVNSAPPVSYTRVWAHNPDDGEHVALDVAFPPSPADGYGYGGADGGGGVFHSQSNPVYMILHGLNGGSNEEYVREFVSRRTAEGSTCVVMVARGLMDTPVQGWNVFHGARVSDAHVAAGAVRKALGRNQLLAGVGYSMGAIVLANYVSRSGTGCHLHAAMSVSGGLDMREQINFYRSRRLWQPMLAKELRDTFIVGKFEARYRHRLTEGQYLDLMRSAHISSIDLHGVVTYNGFDDLNHYYSEMSANGDHSLPRRTNNKTSSTAPAPVDDGTCSEGIGRLSNVSIPFCVLHALDDPLVTWRAVANVDPNTLVKSGSGNLILLLTKSGGHVGWPLGLNPSTRGWEWMNNAVRDFVNSVDAVLIKGDQKVCPS